MEGLMKSNGLLDFPFPRLITGGIRRVYNKWQLGLTVKMFSLLINMLRLGVKMLQQMQSGHIPFSKYLATSWFEFLSAIRHTPHVRKSKYTCQIIEGSLEVKFPTKWTDGQAEVGRVREDKKKREDQRRERVRRKKMQVREKVEKSQFTLFFQWFVVPEGRKVGSLKRRVRSHLARWEMKKCTPLWREAHFQVKMYKTRQLRSTFRSCAVEKVHAIVVRSTFRSQKS